MMSLFLEQLCLSYFIANEFILDLKLPYFKIKLPVVLDFITRNNLYLNSQIVYFPPPYLPNEKSVEIKKPSSHDNSLTSAKGNW